MKRSEANSEKTQAAEEQAEPGTPLTRKLEAVSTQKPTSSKGKKSSPTPKAARSVKDSGKAEAPRSVKAVEKAKTPQPAKAIESTESSRPGKTRSSEKDSRTRKAPGIDESPRAAKAAGKKAAKAKKEGASRMAVEAFPSDSGTGSNAPPANTRVPPDVSLNTPINPSHFRRPPGDPIPGTLVIRPAPTIELARRVKEAVLRVDGVYAVGASLLSQAATYGLPGQTVRGVRVEREPDETRIAVHLTARFVPLQPLAARVRSAVVQAVAPVVVSPWVDVYIDDLDESL